MSYGETKVYFDGSHYIAIPHTERPVKKRPKPIEETITVIQENDEGSSIENLTEPSVSLEQTDNNLETLNNENLEEKTQKEIADMMNISQSYISRLEKKILSKLKKEFVKCE